jgi:hypothetical protein
VGPVCFLNGTCLDGVAYNTLTGVLTITGSNLKNTLSNSGGYIMGINEKVILPIFFDRILAIEDTLTATSNVTIIYN